VVDRHGGRMPADPAALRALPGVGRYTAGAVASIAFGVRAPVVDGNVARVLARVFAVPGRMRSPRFERRVWDLAARLVPSGAAGEWNQALMELGATLCTPRDPSCGRCPVRRRCAAHATATTHRLPAPATRRPITTARRAVAVVESGERLLLVRRSGPLLRGLWEFPGVEVGGSRPAAPLVQRELDRLGLPPPMLVPAGSIRHTILDRRIETEVYRGSLEDASPVRPPGRWMRRARLRSLPLSAAALKIAGDVAARQDRP
jgi:A/G-specific adenine glycosylase